MSGAILVYHRVEPGERDYFRMGIEPGLFREHMQLLTRRFRPARLEEVERARAGVAVTFDDGYASVLGAVSATLGELGVPATFFVNSGALGATEERFWDRLESVLLRPLARELALVEGSDRFVWPLASEAERHKALAEVHARAMRADVGGRAEILRRVLELGGEARPPRAERRMLTAGELRALAARPGHEIGAHGENHLFLPACSPEVQRAELVVDKQRLEALLGREVRALAYPFGASDETSERLAREAGFSLAVRGDPGPVSEASDPFALPRLDAATLSVQELESTLAAHLEP